MLNATTPSTMSTIVAERFQHQSKEKHYECSGQWANNFNDADSTRCVYGKSLDKTASQKRSSTFSGDNGERTKKTKWTWLSLPWPHITFSGNTFLRKSHIQPDIPHCCIWVWAQDVGGSYWSGATVIADPESVCPYKEFSWRQTTCIMHSTRQCYGQWDSTTIEYTNPF